jgi:hypothetical protein
MRLAFSIIAGVLSAVLGLQLLLNALPVSGRGVYGSGFDPQWPIHHMLAHSTFTYSAGWALQNVHVGSINNMGYVAPFDYLPGSRAVMVIGDSYVESLMNSYDETLQGTLKRDVNQPTEVMHFGTAGASLADYLAVAELIPSRFTASWAVLVISDGDFVDGFTPAPGYYAWDTSTPQLVTLRDHEFERGPLASWGRTLALVRYIRYNLKTSFGRLFDFSISSPADQGCKTVELAATDGELIDEITPMLAKSMSLDPSHVILVFDSDRRALEGVHSTIDRSCPTRDSVSLQALRAAALGSGMHIVETRELFANFHEKTGLPLDHAPEDLHWNGNAHRLVAEQVAAIINRSTAVAAEQLH